MPFTTINKSTDFTRNKLFSGNGSYGHAITFDESTNMTPDLVVIKHRNGSSGWQIYDSVRGTDKRLRFDTSAIETTNVNLLHSFDTNGYTLDDDTGLNGSGNTFASWNWKAGTTGSGNTTGSGTYKAYSYSVSTAGGFSIIKYGGNATSGHTIPHHLGVAPKFVMIKKLDGADRSWVCHHDALDGGQVINVDTTDATNTLTTAFNSTDPSSTVITLGTSDFVNGNGNTYVAWCWAEKVGYSKFGKYIGDSSSNSTTFDAPFIWTGFKPSTVIIKGASQNSRDWYMWNNKNLGYNPDNNELYPSDSGAEGTADKIILTSTGFKLNHNGTGVNNNGETYLYMAWGQSTVGSNNVPCTGK